jgi:serine/threonine protein kinase
MDTYCTRPSCSKPQNSFPDLDNSKTIKTINQKFCTNCGMPQLLAGRYIVTKPLARGGFGATFVARDRYTPGMRECVIKQLLPTGLNPQQMEIAKQMFEREGVVLEDLGRHPQIPDLLAYFELEVPGLQAGTTEEFFFLAQEFINGFTLEELIEKTGALSEQEVISILNSLLPVLQFVHDRGSIHRDIKPSNIMARKSDSQFYLLDFGAVKQVTATPVGQKVRSTGIFTPGYGAPEQMRGDRVFPASDLYAFGVTCICLLTAKQPEELFDVSSNSWNWRSQTPSPVSNKLVHVLDMMIQNAPRDRYQSAREVYEALNGSPIPTGMTTAFTAPPNPSLTQPPVTPAPANPNPTINQPAYQPPPVQQSAPQSPPIAPPPAAAPISPVATPAPPAPRATPATPPRQPRTSFVLSVPIVTQLFGAFLIGFESVLVAIVCLAFGLAFDLGLIIAAGFGFLLLLLRATSTIDNKDMLLLALISAAGFWGAIFLGLIPELSIALLISITAPAIALLVAAMGGLVAVVFMTLFRLVFQLLYSII